MRGLEDILREAETGIAQADSTARLKELESALLGKNGEITGLMKQMGSLSAEDKPKFGAAVNEAKGKVASWLESKGRELKSLEQAIQFERERLDVTMPGRPPQAGRAHILWLTQQKIKRVLGGMGFRFFDGPELEEFKYNFDALNYPPDHPAMDAQDTFYITPDRVLRTQCTAIQGRVYQEYQPPMRFFTVGRTFRNEAVDRTHSHTFHQVDCFMIDRAVSMAHLKGTLGEFARAMFGPEVKVRFRPDFFPFVEPGVDYAISSPKLFGGRWVELGGAGLIHASILEAHNIDPQEWSGFAFGLGVERIPMMAYGIDDLRGFLENDLRLLEQFA